MRTTITISLTESLKKEADKLTKEDNFSSVSELFRRSLDLYKKERLLNELRGSQLEMKNGKGKALSSLHELEAFLKWNKARKQNMVADSYRTASTDEEFQKLAEMGVEDWGENIKAWEK